MNEIKKLVIQKINKHDVSLCNSLDELSCDMRKIIATEIYMILILECFIHGAKQPKDKAREFLTSYMKKICQCKTLCEAHAKAHSDLKRLLNDGFEKIHNNEMEVIL